MTDPSTPPTWVTGGWEAERQRLRDAVVEQAMAEHRRGCPGSRAQCAALRDHEASKPGAS